MNKKITRIGSTALALGFGVLLVLFFTELGDSSKGPLEDLMSKIGSMVDRWDSKYITRRSSRERVTSLQWFETVRDNMDTLKNPENILLGAFDNNTESSFQPIFNIENEIGENLPLIHIYSAWGSKAEQRFPLQKVVAIYSLGSIPVLTWEPWLEDFDKEEHPYIKEKENRNKGGLTDVANGVYDFYLDIWVKDLKTYDKPIFIRLGHEMNDPYRYSWGPQNNTPEEYVRAWKHVVDFFRNAGVSNVIWVWSPHPAYGYYKEYYPGDEYVDWVGVGTLNYGDAAVWSKWWTFDEIYGNFYEELASFNKPIMLTEFGCLEVGGDRAEWYREALCNLNENYPATKSVLFFHFNNDITLTNKSLNWYFLEDSLTVESIKKCVDGWSWQ